MSETKHLKKPIDCQCGKKVSKESVFCRACKAIIKRKNAKLFSQEAEC
ncbi:MAG: hypothetical protein ABH823_00840 [bacterium]